MLELRSRKMFPLLPICFFFFHFSSIFVFVFTYSLPDQYFVNCGSGSSVVVYDKTFVGDEKRGGFSLSSGNNNPVQDPSSSGAGLYQSARVFRGRSWYEFNVEQNGTFVVRFHFLPFSSLGNESDARFSVVASGFSLLSQFTAEKSNLLPHIEEFLMTMAAGKFKVYFIPDGDNSFAFVNAIEFFIAPPGFLPDSAPHITREGNRGEGDNYKNLLSLPSRVIHRINVGGKNIMPNNDTLLRSWIPDDPYLFNRETAKDSVPYGFRPQYQNPGATDFDAPDFVYRTAKQMNINDSTRSNLFNITWLFPVKERAKLLLRVHFCDIVSDTSNEGLIFDLYVYSQFSVMIRPYVVIPQLAAPFYIDYQVDSDDSGFINVSVGPNSGSRVTNAFLNGVEIMQLIEDTRFVSEGGGGTHLFIIIGSAVGSAVAVIVILILVLLYLKRRKLKAVEEFDRPLVPLYGGSSYSKTTDKTVLGSTFADLNLGLKLHLSEILYATKNFDTKLIIGEGGFGKVYKGMLRNGTKVAVKRSEPGSSQGVPEFETEIMVLSSIRHNHLVWLVGYCDERDEMILVYEFMEKGTLRDHLYKEESREKSTPTPSSTLSWDQRVRICVGAAKGIHYLHTGSSGVIIHRDIKSTNILLDENYVAKVADFGLSRSGPPDQTHVSTEVKGSFGYLDPEYFKCLQLTQKSDVYSFGVVLLEVLCARPVVDPFSKDRVSLVEWGMSWIKKEQLEQIVDPLLEGKINPGSLRKFGETVEKCLQEYGADRPNMVDVLWDLEYCLQLHQTVTPRAPFEDSMTDVGLPMPVIQRLPSHSLPDEDDSQSFTSTSQVNAGEVFSLLKIDEAR